MIKAERPPEAISKAEENSLDGFVEYVHFGLIKFLQLFATFQ
jgi:hypothetical protein